MRRIIGLVEAEQPLNELRGIRGDVEASKDFKSKYDVIAHMEEKGFTTLGHGMWGAVFDHPDFHGKQVLKLFADPFYEAFIRYSQANASNPHLPKFLGKLIRVTPEARMIRIERLKPISGVDEDFDEALMILADYMLAYNEKPAFQARVRKLADEWNVTDLLPTMLDLARNLPSGAAYDVHLENMMLRDSVPVITDPWAGAAIPFLK